MRNLLIVLMTSALALGAPMAAYAKNDNSSNKPKDDAPKGPPVADTPKETGKKDPELTLCKLSDISPNASACGGFYAGNLNGGSEAKEAESAAALNALFGVDTYTAANLTWLADLGSLSQGDTIDFGRMLYGNTVVSFHVGGANSQADGVGYSGTAFYAFDAGDEGLEQFAFNLPGLSNARLYATETFVPPLIQNSVEVLGVPEPGAWALMIVGFGGVGWALRRRRMLVA